MIQDIQDPGFEFQCRFYFKIYFLRFGEGLLSIWCQSSI